MRVVVSGGGTAGHIAPILAMLDELKSFNKSVDILFIGSGSSIEKKILEGVGLKYVQIPAGKFRRYNRSIIQAALDVKTNWKNTKDFFSFNAGILKAHKILRQFGPDVVFVKGGFVGLPVGIAARRLKLPLVIHESDLSFGMTNQFLAKFAVKVAVGFPLEFYRHTPYKNLIYTGSPVPRTSLAGDKKSACHHFRITEEKPNIFITGGSQGAQGINKVIFDNLELLSKHYNLIHQTGEGDIERARFLASRLPAGGKKSYRPYSFLKSEMGLAYALADVVISRAGANALTNLAVWSKPAIVIPLPSSAQNHQVENARLLARSGAIRVLPQANLTGLRLASEIDGILNNKEAQAYLAQSIRKFYNPQAARDLAAVIYEEATRSHNLKGEKT